MWGLINMQYFWQGYVLYSVRQKLKPQYLGLSGNEIKDLKSSGVEVSLHYCTSEQFETSIQNLSIF